MPARDRWSLRSRWSSEHSAGFEAREVVVVESYLAQDLLGMLAPARRRARNRARRSRELHGLADHALLAVPAGDDLLYHPEMLHLRLVEDFTHIVDHAARNTPFVELADPVAAIVRAKPPVDLRVERVAI